MRGGKANVTVAAPFLVGTMPLLVATVIVAATLMLAFAGAAHAGKVVDRFSPLNGAAGTGAGQFSSPRGVAVNDPDVADGNGTDGWYYVADDSNHRIQAFDSNDEFQFMIGRDVSVAQTTGEANTAAEKCTSAADCKGGSSSSFAGTLGGMFDNPQGVAINQETGHFYVRDRDNQRVQEFDGDGSFVRAWGHDVVQPGGTGESIVNLDERQTVAIAPPFFGSVTGGTFTLAFGAAAPTTTVPVSWNANAQAVEDALVGLGDINAGDVDVLGGPGGATGATFTIVFTGALAGTNLAQIAVGSNNLTGTGILGPATPSVTITTAANGGPAPGYEVCTIVSQCKAGVAGGGVGQLAASQVAGTGIAVNPVNSHVIVADPGGGAAGGKRVLEFQADGTFVRGWGFNVIPSGAPGDLGAAFEVCTVATGCQAVAISSGGGANGAFDNSNPAHVAVDSNGIVYAADNPSFSSHRIMRFDSTQVGGAFLSTPITGSGLLGSGSTTALATEPDSTSVYVARGDGVREFDMSSNPAAVTSVDLVDLHMAGAGLTANGVDLNAASGDMYVTSSSTVPGSGARHRVYVADDDGAAGDLDATLDPPTGVGAHTATFSGTVNPAGFPVDYRFEVSRTGTEGSWTPVAADVDLGSGTDPVDVPVDPAEGQATGLEANTLYRVRIIATRGFGNGELASPELTFLTDAAAPDPATLAVQSLSDTVAQLRGTLNPNNLPTTWWFEYGGPGYGNTAPVPAASATGGVEQTLTQQLGGLSPSTTYHYRLCAQNSQGTSCGADKVFTTRTQQAVPDGRAFELVSPADKLGGTGVGSYNTSGIRSYGVARPARDGERVAVEGKAGAVLLDGAFSYANDWAFAERGPTSSGWVSHSPITHGNYTPSYRRFAVIEHYSDDLSLISWTSNASHIGVFPELADWPQSWDIGHLSDWQGRWEVAGPTDPAQMAPGHVASGGVLVEGVSANGKRAILQGSQSGYIGGLSGPNDPYLDRTAGGATYIEDVSAGLSDTFPGEGVRAPVGVCTDGTEAPEVDGSGDIAGQSCPAGELLAPRGTDFGVTGSESRVENMISADGSRVFFIDQGSGAPAACTGMLNTTSCPSQLYVRQENVDGSVAVRWLSRPAVPGQDSSLLAAAMFEGASRDGDKVFFRTQSPLTSDDPDGEGAAPPPGGVVTGTPGASGNASWDLYMFDLAPGDDPTGPGSSLTRISAGPSGSSDCNVETGGSSLRFASESGQRIYFTCRAPLSGVPASTNGTITNQSGTPDTTAAKNLYFYDAERSPSQRWSFVARLPTTAALDTCASIDVGLGVGSPLATDADSLEVGTSGANCVRGSKRGDFVAFVTRGTLTGDDPDGSSADLYAFDANADRLIRASAAQGGAGESYVCATLSGDPDFGLPCYADIGVGVNLVTDPIDENSRTIFFQSRSRLTPDDDDDRFDVYQWQDGDLTLLTPNTSRDAWYTGSSADGQDVFIEMLDRASWQDVDSVLDVYDLRRGGGIPEPISPTACTILAGACQGGDGGAPALTNAKSLSSSGGEDASPGARNVVAVASPSLKARRRASRTGRLPLEVRATSTGRVSLTVKAKLGNNVRRVGRVVKRVRAGETALVNLRLNSRARKRLRSGKGLRVTIEVRQSGARTRTRSILLPGVTS